jgi:hypothetical protein
MKRKREEDYYSSKRFSSKERKISNDPDGRIRTFSSERDDSKAEFTQNQKFKSSNNIQIYDEYKPCDAAMTFNSGERENTSNAGDSMLSYNTISAEEAQRIHEVLDASNPQYPSTKRNWSQEEIKLLDYAVQQF